MSKIKYVCKRCGSDDVVSDAWARWNVDTQDWELSTVFDYEHCHSCEGETTLIEEIINEN